VNRKELDACGCDAERVLGGVGSRPAGLGKRPWFAKIARPWLPLEAVSVYREHQPDLVLMDLKSFRCGLTSSAGRRGVRAQKITLASRAYNFVPF